MVEVPAVTPVTRPVPLTVAIPGLTLLHTPPGSPVASLNAVVVVGQTVNDPVIVPGIGNEIKLIGAAFNKSYQGKPSEPIAGNTGVFVLQVNNIGAVAASGAEASIRQQLLQNQKMAANRGVSALRKAANIKDYRSKFF